MNLHFGTNFSTNYNRNIPSSISQPTRPPNQNIQMGRVVNISNSVPTALSKNAPKQVPRKIEPSPQDQPKKMKWGEPTWFLLHTLCEKVKDEHFNEIRASLLNIIYLICTNLPCPDCSAHAKQYLDKINMNMIQTKDQLKRVMFDFHNTLNVRKQFRIFKYDDLTKYSNARTINIIYNFMAYYDVKNRSIHMISNDIYRNNMIAKIKDWFNQNIKYFDN